MTAPEPRPTGSDSNARGLAVIVVAVLIGIGLLAATGTSGADDTEAATTPPSSSVPLDAVDTTEATTTTTSEAELPTRAASEVKVIVLNGSGKAGAAGATSETIGGGGYVMATPGNAPTTEVTTIYYDEDYEAEAIAIAGIIGKGTDQVKPLSEASLGGAEGDANVVVVLGADTPPVAAN